MIDDREEAVPILDDSVQDKQYSKSLEMVKIQYIGAVGGLVKGIGVVILVHTNGQERTYYQIDYQICTKEADGKTKYNQFIEMLTNTVRVCPC